MDTVSEFHAEARQATASEGLDLPMVPTSQLERDSNEREANKALPHIIQPNTLHLFVEYFSIIYTVL